MPDHATEAAELLANGLTPEATARALLAIHEQLRVANVIADLLGINREDNDHA